MGQGRQGTSAEEDAPSGGAPKRLSLLEGKQIDSLGRRWTAALHPRDSKGRFIETGGLARVWGSGLARVIRFLDEGHVEIENASGGRRVVPTHRVTMVERPDGSGPTKNGRLLGPEHKRRTADESRGDGFDQPDRGTTPHPGTVQEPARLAQASIDAMSMEQLTALIESGAAYDEATVLAIADRMDELDDIAARGDQFAADKPAAEVTHDDVVRIAGQVWPAAWVDWALSAPAKKTTMAELRAAAEDAWFLAMVARQQAAEAAVNGQWWKPVFREGGRPAAVTIDKVFNGSLPDATVRKYASDELLQWFAENGWPQSRTAFMKDWLRRHRGEAAGPAYDAGHGTEWG